MWQDGRPLCAADPRLLPLVQSRGGAVSNAPRNTATRDRHRAAIKRTKPPCHICEHPIDYSLRSPDPGSFEVDHIIPLDSAKTPEDRAALDVLSNKAASHRACNRAKWKTMPGADAPRTFVTSRTW